MNNQIIKINQLNKLILSLKKAKQKIVLAGGCFDILHLGHIIFLEKSKKEGDKLIVLLESDENIRINKGENRPVNPQLDRAKILISLKSVDYVVLLPKMNKDEGYNNLVNKIKPEIIAVTKGDKKLLQKKKQALEVGAKVIEVNNQLNNRSSTKIIEMISKSL